MKKCCLALAVAAALSLLTPELSWAPWTCVGSVGGRFCYGTSTDSPPVGFWMIGFGGAPITTEQRYYYWPCQAGVCRGLLLSSHHGTVEAGLSDENVRQGNVSLDDSKGVYCVTIGGCLNDAGP